MKRFLFAVLTIIIALSSQAGSYTLKKGNTLTLRCTAQAPAGGWITHAFFDLVNSSDAQYLGINYNSQDCYATLFGLKAKSSIPVEVTYCYSYKGSYDNNIHVGHGTYTDYITVSGPATSTSFKFREGDEIKIPSGGTAIAHVDFYPSGSDPSDFSFGFVSTLGQPYNFTAKTVSGSYDIEITAKEKPGTSAYLAAYINNNQQTVQVATLKIVDRADTPAPTSIDLDTQEVSIEEDNTYKLKVSFNPSNAWSEAEFTSSNVNVATVDKSGVITAVGTGTAIITVKANDLKATCNVTVTPKPKDFMIDSELSLISGYSYFISPSVQPQNAKISYKLTSSDSNIVTVTGQIIKGIRSGTATITISSPETGTKKEMKVLVSHADPGTGVRDATQRVQVIKNLFYSVISQ